jgi:hypothetical protein
MSSDILTLMEGGTDATILKKDFEKKSRCPNGVFVKGRMMLPK